MKRFVSRGAFAACLLVCGAVAAAAQAASSAAKPAASESVKTLERDFFDAIRNGDAQKVLSYIPKSGVNARPDAHHLTREEVEQQFQGHRGLYCYLFDSSCVDAAIDLGNSKRACSDRELLTHSEKVRTASSEVTRNNVQQAILVAEVKNDQCANVGLVDFILNLEADGWKLFSIP
jgi:hypothetical protein